MRLFLFAQRFAPEAISGAVLATELACDLAARGHQVAFITGAPSYPAGVVYPGYRNAWLAREALAGVQVFRTWSLISPRRTTLPRLLNYGTFSATAFYGGLAARRALGRPDVLFSYSPPLPLGVSAWMLSRLWRVPWLLRVEDLYPDAAVAAGIIRPPTLQRFFYWLERALYERATHISLISEGFRQKLLEKGVPAVKLSVTPVWADPEAIRPAPRENAFRRIHKLEGRFVVLYAGNLGHNSCLEDVLEAAHLLRDHPTIRFVITGEGIKKAQLQALAAQKGLRGVIFLPYQPRAQYAEMLAAADVSLVTLSLDSSWTSLPSKTFNIMASGRPILAITPAESEVARLVSRYRCGINLPPGNPAALADELFRLSANGAGLIEMGARGRRGLEAHFSREACVDQFEHRLLDLVR